MMPMKQKADGEHHAVAQGDESLSAEIAAHAAGNVTYQQRGERAVADGDEVNPAAGVFLIVCQQEEQVQQGDERHYQIENDIGGGPEE